MQSGRNHPLNPPTPLNSADVLAVWIILQDATPQKLSDVSSGNTQVWRENSRRKFLPGFYSQHGLYMGQWNAVYRSSGCARIGARVHILYNIMGFDLCRVKFANYKMHYPSGLCTVKLIINIFLMIRSANERKMLVSRSTSPPRQYKGERKYSDGIKKR